MKKIIFLLSLISICSTTQLSAMKRAHDQLTESTDYAGNVLALPDDMIIKIGVSADPQSRENFALTNKRLNQLVSIKNNPAIVNHDDLSIEKENRLYYLFYGCMHNLSNLVTKALKKFDLKKKDIHTDCLTGMVLTSRPEKTILKQACHYIKQLPNTDATKLLPNYPEQKTYLEESIFDFIADNDDAALFKLCIKNSTWNDHKACGDWFYALTESENCTNQEASMLKMALICNRFDGEVLVTANPTLTKILIDYDTIHDINRQDNKGNTLLHMQTAEYDDVCRQVAKVLLTHPYIDVNVQDKDGNTPLHNAVTANNLETVLLLLTNPKTKIDLENKLEQTPLHLALANLNVVDRWVLSHSDFIFGSAEWLEALQIYAQSNKNKHAIVAQLLLAQGLIKHIKDYPGM